MKVKVMHFIWGKSYFSLSQDNEFKSSILLVTGPVMYRRGKQISELFKMYLYKNQNELPPSVFKFPLESNN